ncbi:trichohyalin isoform X2 [Anabas testudineus]|uniref:trichohyalin isoform X2 n=1 Tax=Anabas testudineus TaxID=64144 RepID=UPI000E45D620|nr:trichohyalin isoform X2 [Anabas testudineus]
MEDNMTSSYQTGTGSSSVAMVMDSTRTDPDLCDRVKVLEQKVGSTIQSDSYVRNSFRQFERSDRSLLLQLCQLNPSMQHSQRLDQRLHLLREEVRTMTQEKEREERVWRERLQRCQRQLKAKEEEMSRQSQYFENFKTQLQHKLSLARDREQILQNRIYTLEKQLLDMTVSAATGIATGGAVRITAGSITCWEQQERLTSIRGEGEGEEERKEERRKQWQSCVGGGEDDEGKTEMETGSERSKDTRQSSNEAKLQGFILSLQEDLRVLLEREEDGMTERRRLMEQLQEAQENSHFLSCKLEEMKAEVQQLKLSESSLMEEVEGLREENHRLEQILSETADQTHSQSSQISESTCPSLMSSSLRCSTAVCPVPNNTVSRATATTHSSEWNLGEVQPTFDEGVNQSYSPAVSHAHHQAAAETAHNNTDDHSSSATYDPLKVHKPNPSFQSLSLTSETINEFKMGTWCSRGILNLEENHSEESDALRDACKSLGLQDDLEPLQEQIDALKAALQRTQQQLQVMSEENSQLKLQLKKQTEEEVEVEAEQESTREKDDLVQALNQENQALADRIQKLLVHIELREKEIVKEETQLREHISRLEVDRAKMEQENEEQGCLITELTRKTEDDLNTIMDLQQKLEESGEQHNQEESVDSMGESVLKGEEAQLISTQQIDDLTTASVAGSQHNDHNDSTQNNPQTNTLHVGSVADQVDQLTKLIQSLKTEQEELSGYINSLREQQREVALSVQTQTEEKQQLTRTVWGLKEEKDRVSHSLAGLKQEREELSRTVVGLRDSRDNFVRSTSQFKEEKKELTKILSDLEKEKQELIESVSSRREERDHIMQSVQCLQREREQLNQVVLNLNQERDELNNSLKCLKEQRDQDQSSYTLQEDRNTLMKSVNSLKEEKQLTEDLISGLKQEEAQIRLEIQGLRGERNSLQTPLHSQTQTEERKTKQDLSNLNCADMTQKTETVQTAEQAAQRNQTNNLKGDSIQEQSDLMREIEALGEQLKRSREELEKTHAEIKTLHSELCQSEVRREEAEKRATHAAENMMRLTDVAGQMEETRQENESLNKQVKELQSKLTRLIREKTNTLSLKTQAEEQYSILAAQLKAKTVALEELNTEYIALKREQTRRDDLSTVLTSLRTRYDDIRAKYDALLRRKSHTDLDIAPLKAKLSCLVLKCQERNSLLLQMMKAMHQHGFVDSTLTQQVKQLLSDAALQDYTAAFPTGTNTNTWDYSSGFILKSSGPTADLSCSVSVSPSNKHQHGSISKDNHRDLKNENNTSHTASESSTSLQDCSGEIQPGPTAIVKKDAKSSVPVSPVQEHTSVQVSPSPAVPLKEALSTNTAQLSVSASGPHQATSDPEKLGFHNLDIKRKSFPDLTSATGSSLIPATAHSRTGASLSRRLSSPEKIMNLHEQLQKTLKSSYQASDSRGRGQQPRKSLSFSAPAELCPASQTQKPHTNSFPVTSVSSQVTTKPAATNKSATLFNAVASRSAHLALSSCTHMLINNHIKSNMSKPTTSALSSSVVPNRAKSLSSSSIDLSVSAKPTKEVTAIPDMSTATHKASIPLALKATNFECSISNCSDTNPKTTASDTTASSVSAAPKVNIFNMTSKMDGAAYDGFTFAASCTQSPHHSPESSSKSARRSTTALDKNKTSRPKPEAPAEVCSVEVIKTVGQSSLLIGWERPPLDELGCSNGTFVFGYRVYIDGDFHKSVMSSACTKCIVENVDLSVPVNISVQTLGSNGLSSNSVHTMYRADQY